LRERERKREREKRDREKEREREKCYLWNVLSAFSLSRNGA